MALAQCRTKISECRLGEKTISEAFYGVAFGVENNDRDDEDANDSIESNQRS